VTSRRRAVAARARGARGGSASRRRGGTGSPGRGPGAVDPPGPEAGITLLEILIAVMILGLLIGTLSAAVVMGFRSNVRAEASIDRSNLVAFTSRLFNRDVASATGAPVPGGGCGNPAPAVNIPLDGGRSAAYAVVATASPARSSLVRRVCSGAAVVSSREIGTTKWAMTAAATCQDTGAAPDTVACGRVTLEVDWPAPEEYSFRLTADRRATAS